MTTVAVHSPILRDAGGAAPVIPRPSRTLDRRGSVMPWARAVASGELAAALLRDFGHVPEPQPPAEFPAVCVGLRDEAAGVRTVFLRRGDGVPLAHRPGQYVRLALPVAGAAAEPLERCYSISTTAVRAIDAGPRPASALQGRAAGMAPVASASDRRLPLEAFAVTVKRQPGGLGSNWIHDVLAPGMVLEAQGPLGGFHLPDFDRRARYLLLAAGAGITPILSMVRTLAELPGPLNAVVLYHCSSPADFAFAAELHELAAACSGLRLFLSLGDRAAAAEAVGTVAGEVPIADAPEEALAWPGRHGRIRRELLDEFAADACGRRVYACGPAGYLEAVRHAVAEAGVPRNSYFEESFDESAHVEERVPPRWRKRAFVEPGRGPDGEPLRGRDSAAAPEVDGDDPGDDSRIVGNTAPLVPGLPTVTFRKTGATVSVARGESLLDAGRRAGVPLKSNCRTGACGTCKVAKLAGTVQMEHGGGIRQREVDAGKILLCCATPEGDVEVDG